MSIVDVLKISGPIQTCLRASGWTAAPRIGDDPLCELLAPGINDGLTYHDNTISFFREFAFVWLGYAGTEIGAISGYRFDGSQRHCFLGQDQSEISSQLGSHWDPIAVDGYGWSSLWISPLGQVIVVQHEGGGWASMGSSIEEALETIWSESRRPGEIEYRRFEPSLTL